MLITFIWSLLIIFSSLFFFTLFLYVKFTIYDKRKINKQLHKMNQVVLPALPENNFQILNPYQGEGTYHKAQLHSHSTKSDGQLTPHQLVQEYRKRGYKFLAITDHDQVTNLKNKYNKDRDIILITGEEMTYPRLFWPLGYHISRLFVENHLHSGNLQARLNQTTKNKGISIINHPSSPANLGSQQWFPEKLQNLNNYFLMEIANPHTVTDNNLCYWHALLKQSGPEKPLWGVAGDDTHRKEHIDQNYIMVKTDIITKYALFNSLVQGRFFASQGPTLKFDVSDHTIQVEVTSEGKNSTKIKFIDADFVIKNEIIDKKAKYKVSGQEGFVRIEVEDLITGKQAWSQPFWLIKK